MKKQYIYDRLKRKDGSTLLMTVVVFLVITIILMGSSMLALSNFNRSKTTSEYTSVYYVAEAGLNRYVEELEDYVKINQAAISSDLMNLGTKFASSISPGSDNVTYDFGTLMNDSSHALIEMDYISTAGGVFTYTIKSTGNLGYSSRSITTSVSLTVEYVGEDREPIIGIDAPAILSFDPEVSNEEIGIILGGSKTIEGPYITNLSVHKKNDGSTKLKGPLVIGGNLNVDAGFSPLNAIIVNGDFNKISSGGNTFISALMITNSDSYVRVYQWNTNIIGYLFVPNGFNLSQIQYYTNNQSLPSSDLSSYISKIIYYNPVNFDPYSSSSYISSPPSQTEIIKIFGEKDLYPYKSYFSPDFILNSDSTNVEDVLPTYKLPAFPTLGSNEYPWINDSNFSNLTGNTNIVSNYSLKIDGNVAEPRVKFNRNLSLKNLTISNVNSLARLYIGDNDIEILVESLNITKSNIEIIGKGKLTIKVVGKNGIVEQFVLQPNYIKMREIDNGEIINDPSKLRLIVNKTNNGSRKLSYETSNSGGANVALNAVIISEDLNLKMERNFHGAFISLSGETAIITSSGESKFSGLLYVPKALVTVQNELSGSVVARKIDITNSGYEYADYVGSMNNQMISDILGFLDFKENGSNGGLNGGSNGGSIGGGSGNGGQTTFSFTSTPPREIGD